ncbi:TPA: hypothetical protein ACHK36_RS22725, partial [Escherichia coli]
VCHRSDGVTAACLKCFDKKTLTLNVRFSKLHSFPHPAPQNAGQYFELPGSGQGLSSQPEA